MIVVNSSTRQFNIPGADLVFGVTADAGSEVKHFQCPRYVGNNVDIASSFVRINYRNATGEIDFYLVKDVTVDGDNVTFYWELSPKVTMYKGNISFVMCVVGPDTKVKWHTTLGRGQVLEGLEPDNAQIESETEDGIAALIAMVEAQTEAVESKGVEWVRNVQSEGTDQIVAVQTAGKEAEAASVAEIEAKGVNVRESIPEDYTALSEAVNTLNRTRGAVIVCEAAGETVVVGDSSNLPMQGLQVFGKTTQATTTGAQILELPDSSKLDRGLTVVVANGVCTVNGTAAPTDGTMFECTLLGSYNRTDVLFTLEPGTYTLTDCTIVSYDGTNRVKHYLGTTFTLTEAFDVTWVATRAYRLDEVVKETTYPMINNGNVALPFETYTGGKPSPSPEYPQELVSLEPVVTVGSKNLFDKNKYVFIDATTIDNDTGELKSTTPDGWRSSENLIMVKPNTTYMLSGGIVPNSWTITVAFYDSNKKFITFTKVTNYGGRNNFKFETPENTAYLRFNAHLDSLDINTVQLEEGSAVSDYETGNSQLLAITHTLPGIPVASGGNYTDSDGQQWVCDEVDLERGVYVQRVYGETFDGSDDEKISIDQTGTETYHYTIRTGHMLKQGVGLCSHYPLVGVYSQNSDEGFCPIANSIVRFRWGEEKTLADFKAELQSNPVNVLYVLVTPIETALSETEIAAYRALHSNYPNTTVLNDCGAHMVVKYAADTKLYIDNKIAALIGG